MHLGRRKIGRIARPGRQIGLLFPARRREGSGSVRRKGLRAVKGPSGTARVGGQARRPWWLDDESDRPWARGPEAGEGPAVALFRQAPAARIAAGPRGMPEAWE